MVRQCPPYILIEVGTRQRIRLGLFFRFFNVQREYLNSDFNTGLRHALFGLAHGIFAEMEYARGQHRIGMTGAYTVHEMVEIAHAAGGDYGDTHGVAYRAR